MFKKSAIIGTTVLLLLALFVFGRSHVLTTFGLVKQSVKESVPVDFEIKRARQMIKDLEPEIRRNMHLIAKEEVEVARLDKHRTGAEEQLAKDRDDILRLKGDLDSGSETFVYAGRTYSAKEVKVDLTNRFEQFKTQEATAESLTKMLRARECSLKAARQKLEGMLQAKRQLEIDVENLEARLKMVEVAQTTSDFNFDDSQLARTKELISDIRTRIEVAEKLVNSEGKYLDRIPLDEPEANRDITEEIANYFGQRRAEIEAYVNANR